MLNSIEKSRMLFDKFLVARLLAIVLVLSIWAYQFAYESRGRWVLELAPVRLACGVFLVLYIAVFVSSGAQAFIYFQF